MAYYDVSSDYGGYGKPETKMPVSSTYDADVSERFLCDGAGGESLCDFGYADFPANGNGTAAPMVTGPGGLEQVAHSQAWFWDHEGGE